MTKAQLSPDELLTTTRAVRKRLDLQRDVPMALLEECVEIARQAPTGSNSQGWHFMLVDDSGLRKGLADLYRQGWNRYLQSPGSLPDTIKSAIDSTAARDLDAQTHNDQMERVLSSAQYLADNLERVPVLLIPCVKGRSDQMTGPYANAVHSAVYGSIIPATWNYMLAARARGLGTAWTSAHLIYEREAADLLGIPYDEFTQVAMIPTAFYTGDSFKPALRKPLAEVLHHNRW
jgi:nitroreductase